MTKQQIIETVKQGGYICRTEDTRPTVYDYNGRAVCDCPIATMNSIATLDGISEWVEEWGAYYVGGSNRGKHNEHENRAHCKSIADDIDDYIGGRVFKCPECGEIIHITDDREKHLCYCGYVDDIDEFEQLGIYDYFDDILDIEYRIGTDKTLRSVQIMVACGGPNIYIDTASRRVELYWWGNSADYPLSSDAVASIDEWAEELYNI